MNESFTHTKEVEHFINYFKKTRGRKLRILHIGNIANNAYNNAKILNSLGIDSDVICYDYYHIMGCPEWEDADFDATNLDNFKPNWFQIDLKRFERPRWFAQGPQQLCIDYLIAKQLKDHIRENNLWEQLCYANGTKAPSTNCAIGVQVSIWWNKQKGRLRRLLLQDDVLLRVKSNLTRKASQLGTLGVFGASIIAPVILSGIFVVKLIARGVCKLSCQTTTYDIHRKIEQLVMEFSEIFPNRPDQLTTSDFTGYTGMIGEWSKLLEYYDIVIAYSTDVVYPMLAGKRPYIAYEHGTIRDIPFENSLTGRLTALGYARADVVYMTNADSLKQAKELRIARTVHGLHGFSPARFEGRLAKALNSSRDARFDYGKNVKVFFGPARQHWRDGFPSWRKGNDLVIRAAAHLVNEYPDSFRLVFVEWGAEINLSKILIEELGISNYVVWLPPMGKDDLLRAYRSVDCVIDQFVLPCIGSVTLEAIAVGVAPVITMLDDEVMSQFYGESIPLFNCASVEQVKAAMSIVILDEVKSCEVSSKSNKWFLECHSGQILEDKLMEAINTASANL